MCQDVLCGVCLVGGVGCRGLMDWRVYHAMIFWGDAVLLYNRGVNFWLLCVCIHSVFSDVDMWLCIW